MGGVSFLGGGGGGVVSESNGSAGSGLTAVEAIAGIHRTTLTLENVSVAMTDAGAAGCHGNKQVYTFPAGNIHIIGGVCSLTVTKGVGGIDEEATVLHAIGSAAAGTNNATLTSTEANILPQGGTILSAGSGAINKESTAPVTVDGTASAAAAFLNLVVADTDSNGNDTLTVSGTIQLQWVQLGDN